MSAVHLIYFYMVHALCFICATIMLTLQSEKSLLINISMQQKIIILDFGSQTTQLIGRRVRELNTYCEIVPLQ